MAEIDKKSLLTTRGQARLKKIISALRHGFLSAVTVLSAGAILFILFYIFERALPFFRTEGPAAFFESEGWYPTEEPPSFGALGIFVGSGLVTLGSCLVALPMGLTAAVCLSDVLPFKLRQVFKPVVELLAAIPSVVYGFFALVIFTPVLQERGGALLAVALWAVAGPLALLASIVLSDLLLSRLDDPERRWARPLLGLGMGAGAAWGLVRATGFLLELEISTGVNALNASLVLALMALPTVVSVCEDALNAVGRELREGSYALGATRAETITHVVVPAAGGGILAAVLLGVMRAVGETMVVLMAAGNSIEIPEPWYNLLSPVRTITATIAMEMKEVDQTTGSTHYHALFALGLFLLVFSFVCNMLSEWSLRRTRKKLGS